MVWPEECRDALTRAPFRLSLLPDKIYYLPCYLTEVCIRILFVQRSE